MAREEGAELPQTSFRWRDRKINPMLGLSFSGEGARPKVQVRPFFLSACRDSKPRPGDAVVHALSQAQPETLRNPATSGPFYWAGFVVMGGS